MPGLQHLSHGPTQAAISFSVSVKQHWGKEWVKGNLEMIFFCNHHLTILFFNKRTSTIPEKHKLYAHQ